MKKWIRIKAGNCRPSAEAHIKKARLGYNVLIEIPFCTKEVAEDTLRSIEDEACDFLKEDK